MEDKVIEKVDFTNEELETNYYECTFDKCNFSGKTIGRVIFERCTFKECNLSLVKASNTSWLNVFFIDCKMTGINFSLSNRFGLSVEFRNSILSYALFTEMKLKDTCFTRCDLQNADFMETDLSGVKFTECDLAYASFHHTNLEKADFSTARNYALNPVANRLRKAKFSRYGLEGLLTGLGIEIVD
ncbi:pentapeptide repeat-containing protein [Bacteroides sp. UBA939]|uniref:pentapeptide repeat-containing protein n=1 Tax=Bacteroides sp. UBA939 TaxID=1946092 RepID=UPI0025C70842|nr:pentapeptide repeat-containing protein [Bacteroides sp. UBA939]